MQKSNDFYRVLVFNRCKVRLRYLARTGHSFHLVNPEQNPQKIWQEALCSLPDNVVEVEWATADGGAHTGSYDLVLCQSVRDLAISRQWAIPRLFAPLGSFVADTAVPEAVYDQLQPLLEGVAVVFDSDQQQRAWGLRGTVIGMGVDPTEFAPATGEVASVLRFCTDASDSETGLTSAEAVLGGEFAESVAEIAVAGMGWNGVKDLLRRHRVFLGALGNSHGDGHATDALIALIAMAAGVPVVTTANSSSPVTDGYNGYISNDYRYLRERLHALLNEPDLAAELGRNARQTIEQHFNIHDRIPLWNDAFSQCIARSVDWAPGKTAVVAPKVSIAIPVYNKAEFTETCLFALAQNTDDDPPYEVIVINNASTDWTQYLLHAFEGDLRVEYNDQNEGFARANNQAAAIAEGEYLLFLNNDTAPQPGWLSELVRLADSDPSIGIVGAKLLYPETGLIQHAGIELINGIPDHIHRDAAADDPLVNSVRDFDMVTGACMLVRRHLFAELRGFDEAFLNGVEDVDLCLRARERGWRVVYCPTSVVEHHEGRSEGRYDNVRENLERFVDRWQGRFDAQGRLVVGGKEPTLSPSASSPPASHSSRANAGAMPDSVVPVQRPFRGNWQGPFRICSSLAAVNRELAMALLREGRCELGLVRYEPGDSPEVELDGRFSDVVERLDLPLDGEVDFHVRHHWPPDFSRPDVGKLVVIQPWEFGRIPRDWVEPIRQNVHQIWAYTNYVRDCYVASGIDPDIVEVVRLGVDPERFLPGLSGLDLPTTKTFKFLFVGGTLERKGIDCLLKAYRAAFTPADDVCLVIKDMGTRTFYRDQTAGEEIRALQNDPHCADILYLTEDIPEEDVPRLYAACDCLVHPYRGEGFGLPVAEAMACGLPVVVTSGGACDDFCDADTAYLVSARRVPVDFAAAIELVGTPWLLEPNFDELKARLRTVFEEPEAARRIGEAAAKHIAANFTWHHAAEDACCALAKLRQAERLESIPQSVLPEVNVEPVAASKTEVILLVLGDVSEERVAEVMASLPGTAIRRDIAVDPAQKLGAVLEAARREVEGEYLVCIGPEEVVEAEGITQLLAHMRQQADIAVAQPSAPGEPKGVGLVDLEIASGETFVFRMETLATVGGFDGSFCTRAVLSEASRQLGRQGARVVKVLECASAGSAQQAFDEIYQDELTAVGALAEGDQMRALGDDGAALLAYRRSVAAKEDYVEAIVVLAAMLMESERSAEAVQHLEQLVQLDEYSFQAYTYLGLAHYQAGQVEAARSTMKRAHQLNPVYVETLVNLAVLEWEHGDPEDALYYLEKAAALEPDNRDVIVNTGIMYAQTGNPEAGIGLLREYLALNPLDQNAASSLADLLIETGDLDAARELAGQMLALDPQFPLAQAILERIRGQEEQD